MNFFYFRKKAVGTLLEALATQEAWSPARKQEMEAVFRERGFRLVAHAAFGDYDLSLWLCTQEGDLYGRYAVAFNSGQYDPGEEQTQKSKVPAQGALPWDRISSKLGDWASQYGRLLISSVDARKLKAYRRLLAHEFTIENYDPDHPEQSFWISAAR